MGGAYQNRGLRLANEGLFEEEIEVREQAVEAFEASIPFTHAGGPFTSETARLEPFAAISTASYWISNAHRELGKYTDAIVAAEQELKYARQASSRNSEFEALRNLASLQDDLGQQYLDEGDYDRAIESYEQGLQYAQEQLNIVQSFIESPQLLSEFESNEPDLEQRALQSLYNLYHGLIDAHMAQNEYDLAIEISKEKLEIAQQMSDSVAVFSSLNGLYVLYSQLNRYPEAIDIAHQGIKIAQQVDDRVSELTFIMGIASVQQNLGDYLEATATYEKSLLLAQELNIIELQTVVLKNLGALYGIKGEYNKSTDIFSELLQLNRDWHIQIQESDSLENLLESCSLGQNIYSNESEDSSRLSGLDHQRNLKRFEFYQESCTELSYFYRQSLLSEIATNYNHQGRYFEALELLEQSLNIVKMHLNDAHAVESNAEELELLNSIGHVYFSQGQYSTALGYYNQALEIATANGYQSNIAWITANIGNVLSVQGDYSSALDRHYSALEFTRDTGLRPNEIDVLINIGRTYHNQAEYSQALEILQQAFSLSAELGHKPEQADIFSDLSLISEDQGNHAQALKYAEQSLDIYEEIGAQPKVATVLVSIGRIHATQGDYVAAIAAQQQALDITIAIEDLDDEAYARQQLALTYSQMGQYDRALSLNQQALAITQRIGNVRREASTLDALGTIYSQQDDSQQALAVYAQALTIWQEIGDPVGEANSLRNAGFLKERLGDYGAAKEDFQNALAIHRRIGSKGHEGLTLNGLAKAQAAEGNLDEATTLLRQAIALHQETGDRPGRAQALSDLGAVLLQTGQLTAAETTLYEAIALVESLRPSELKDTDKIALFDTQLAAYDTLQQVLVAQNDPAKAIAALEVAERGRARAFVESLTVRLGDRSDLEIDPASPDLDQMQQIAQQQNATLVEYSIVGADDAPELYIWVIAPTGDITFRQQSLAGIDLADRVIEARDAIQVRGSRAGAPPRPRPETLAQRRAETNAKLTQLHELLIAPIADLLPTDPQQRVILVPQGDLFLVPFAALLNADGNYLMEQHTLLTAPSLHVLALTQQRRQQQSRHLTANDDVLVVGNPDMPKVQIPSEGREIKLPTLFWAEREAVQIAALFGAEALTGGAATEAHIKQQMAAPRLLHLATHGLLEYGFPDESGVRDLPGAIALAPGNGEDGLLTAAEIYGMNLNADLVVLSACDTGRGRITGDGVVGLSRAFISAGAPSVVVSLWAVSDESTAELMVEFYQQLDQGQDKAQALRQAMLTMLQQYPEDPKHWAAFTLIGEAN